MTGGNSVSDGFITCVKNPSETKFPWTRGRVVEIQQQRGDQGGTMIRWVDCLNWEQQKSQIDVGSFVYNGVTSPAAPPSVASVSQSLPTTQPGHSHYHSSYNNGVRVGTWVANHQKVHGAAIKTRWSKLSGLIQPAGSILPQNILKLVESDDFVINKQQEMVAICGVNYDDHTGQITLKGLKRKEATLHMGASAHSGGGFNGRTAAGGFDAPARVMEYEYGFAESQGSAAAMGRGVNAMGVGGASPRKYFEVIGVDLEDVNQEQVQQRMKKFLTKMKTMKELDLYSNDGWIRVTPLLALAKQNDKMLLYTKTSDGGEDSQQHQVEMNPLFIAEPGTFVHLCKVCQSSKAIHSFLCHTSSAGSSSHHLSNRDRTIQQLPEICGECMTMYLTTSIAQNDLKDLCCPFSEHCSKIMTVQFVRNIDNDLATAYEAKLKRMQAEANRTVVMNDPKFAKWAKNKLKECPHCSVRIEKNEGCDHMKCYRCGKDFQWDSEGVLLPITLPIKQLKPTKHGNIQCATCRYTANNKAECEKYFTKKQRSKARQGKAPMCIQCTQMSNGLVNGGWTQVPYRGGGRFY
jgi:hypothetical protein